MERNSDIIRRKSKAASILVHIQPALMVLTVTAYAILRFVLWIKDSIAKKQGLQIPFREGGPEFALFLALCLVFAVGVFTAAAAIIVRRNTWGWTKPYVLPLSIVEIALGIPALYFISAAFLIK